MPDSGNLLIARPRITLPALLPVSWRPFMLSVFSPLISMSRGPAWVKPGCVVASMTTGWTMFGRFRVVGVIVCGPDPGMLNVIVSRGPGSFASKMAWKSDPGPLSFVLVTTSVLAPGVMVVSTNAALLAGLGSAVVPVTPALLDSVPPARGRTTTVIAAVPVLRVPSGHVRRVRSMMQLPDPPTLTRSAIEPHEKSSCTPVAGFGPLFVTAML